MRRERKTRKLSCVYEPKMVEKEKEEEEEEEEEMEEWRKLKII